MIQPDIAELLKGRNFGMLTTLLKDGSPMTQVMWVDCDDEHVLMNTERHRQKYKNVMRDPRVSVAVWDRGDAYRYVEIRGRLLMP